jgi:hypothetical protein
MVEPQPSSGDAEARARQAGRFDANPEPASSADSQRGTPPPANSDPCVLLAPPDRGEWLGRDHRRLERYPVQASRPIALRLLDGSGQPQGRWFLADILDISRGGLCLMVSGPMQLPGEQRLQLDVRCHPDFGRLRLESVVRWCRSSIAFTTLGLAFLEQLPRVPRLELERRTVRRDPNTEAWAQE